MNWKEFKEYIERQGVKDETIISYIDISYPSNEHPPNVKIENGMHDGKHAAGVIVSDSV